MVKKAWMLVVCAVLFAGCGSEEGGGGSSAANLADIKPAVNISLYDSDSLAKVYASCSKRTGEGQFSTVDEWTLTVNGTQIDGTPDNWDWDVMGTVPVSPGDELNVHLEVEGGVIERSITMPGGEIEFSVRPTGIENYGDTLPSPRINVFYSFGQPEPEGVVVLVFPQEDSGGPDTVVSSMEFADAGDSTYFDLPYVSQNVVVRVCAVNYEKFNQDFDEFFWYEDENSVVARRCISHSYFVGLRVWMTGDTIRWSPAVPVGYLVVSVQSDTVWWLWSDGDVISPPVVYGQVPAGCHEEVSAQPLESGRTYTIDIRGADSGVHGRGSVTPGR